jgi:hypothetical protein
MFNYFSKSLNKYLNGMSDNAFRYRRLRNRAASRVEHKLGDIIDNTIDSIFDQIPSFSSILPPPPAPIPSSPQADTINDPVPVNFTESNRSEQLGQMGELLSIKELERIFDSPNVLQNVYVLNKNNLFTEIDIIVVSQIGVFVIESKNYSGSIRCNLSDLYWQQTVANGNRYKLINPITQNNSHVNALRNLLRSYPKLKFFSLIVFSDMCELINIPITPVGTFVIQRQNMLKTIVSVMSNNNTVLFTDEVDSIINILSPMSKPCESIKQQHRNQFKYKTG